MPVPAKEAGVRRLRDVPELPRWAPESVVTAWELAQRADQLSAEEEAGALARLDHPEFFLLWDREDELPGEFLVAEMNPRVHVLLHQIVETQLLQNEPPAARAAVAHLLGLGVDRHAAIHLLGAGLTREIHGALTDPERRPGYTAHLQRLLHTRPGAYPGDLRPGPEPGRNDPCPCDSGKKYKKCCGDGPPPISLQNTRMVLGEGWYAGSDGLDNSPRDARLLYLENLSAVARALQMAEVLDAAAECYRRLVVVAGEVGAWVRQNALRDQLEFALNSPEHAADGSGAGPDRHGQGPGRSGGPASGPGRSVRGGGGGRTGGGSVPGSAGGRPALALCPSALGQTAGRGRAAG